MPFIFHSLLRDEIEVEPEVLQHVAQVNRRARPVAADLLVCEFAGLLEASILEVGVEFELGFHGSTLPLSGVTLHSPAELLGDGLPEDLEDPTVGPKILIFQLTQGSSDPLGLAEGHVDTNGILFTVKGDLGS